MSDQGPTAPRPEKPLADGPRTEANASMEASGFRSKPGEGFELPPGFAQTLIEGLSRNGFAAKEANRDRSAGLPTLAVTAALLSIAAVIYGAYSLARIGDDLTRLKRDQTEISNNIVLAIQRRKDETLRPPSGSVEPITISNVINVLKQDGSLVERHNRAAGDPWLDIRSKDISWRIYFAYCEAERCKAMTMQAVFGSSVKGPKLIEAADAWNATRLFSRAFSGPDGTITMAADVSLVGASDGYVNGALTDWVANLSEFEAYFARS